MKYVDIPILMYHDVGNYAHLWCVSVNAFKEQMQFLKLQGFRTISFDELGEGIKLGKETSEKLVVITFDDAREGVYDHAFPLLKMFGFTATVYVVPQWVSGKEVPAMEAYSRFLSWEQLEVLKGEGWTIGYHSHDHKDLTAFGDDELTVNLEDGEAEIRNKLGVSIQHFCYPYGKYNDKVLEIVREKYKTAVGITKGFQKKEGCYDRQWILRETSFSVFQKLLQRPTIAVAMIVRDEEKHLERCLRSVYGLVDEIVVVDTGSGDRTKELAEVFTSKVYSFVWQDDFAVARNEALKHVESDWIFILDADEVITEQDYDFILQAVQEWTIAGYRILTRNYCDDSSIDGWQPVVSDKELSLSAAGWYPSLKVRLFQKGYFFKGRVHEMVDYSLLEQDKIIASLPVVVHHYGMLENSAQKLQRNILLAQKKINDHPEDARAYCELGIQYKELGEFSLAEEMLRHSLSLEFTSIEGRSVSIINLAVVLHKQGKFQEAIDVYRDVLEKENKHAGAFFGLGYCFFQLNKTDEARHYFQSAVQFNPFFVDAYVNLGALVEKQGNYTEAVSYLKKALQLHPRHARARYNLGVVYEKMMNIPSAIRCYKEAAALNYKRKEELLLKVEKMEQFVKNHSS